VIEQHSYMLDHTGFFLDWQSERLTSRRGLNVLTRDFCELGISDVSKRTSCEMTFMYHQLRYGNLR
jgi:hypothetical protein